jgi:hypothetical protein
MMNTYRQHSKPQWKGEEGDGRTLFIYAEQGFGDTLQFCRYAPLATARSWKVILQVQPALQKLIQSMADVEQVITSEQMIPNFDSRCPMMSLPLAFGTKLETIPHNVPYLSADETTVEKWRTRLPEANGKLRVGLVWAGSARAHSPDLAAADRHRSMNPELLAPLLDTPNTQFFSLQKLGIKAPDGFALIDYMDECQDFADTAALITTLDLVISVDTAIVHLTGAMGKPVWVMNRFNNCWRWLQKREDSPWYPSLRLFRQPEQGDWETVVAAVKQSLMGLSKTK